MSGGHREIVSEIQSWLCNPVSESRDLHALSQEVYLESLREEELHAISQRVKKMQNMQRRRTMTFEDSLGLQEDIADECHTMWHVEVQSMIEMMERYPRVDEMMLVSHIASLREDV